MDQNQQDFLVSDIIAQNGIVAIHDLNYVTIHLTPLHLSVDLLEADRELEVFQSSDQPTALVVAWRVSQILIITESCVSRGVLRCHDPIMADININTSIKLNEINNEEPRN